MIRIPVRFMVWALATALVCSGASGIAADKAKDSQKGKAAQTQKASGKGKPVAVRVAVSAELTGHLAKFDDFVGLDVRSQGGEPVGEIADVVINQKNGDIAYAVVSRGGLLGIAAEQVGVPMGAFIARHTARGVFLQIAATQEEFKQAKALGEKNWPGKASVNRAKKKKTGRGKTGRKTPKKRKPRQKQADAKKQST